MSDPLTWSPIRLGRWFRTPVRVHILLILFVVFVMVVSAGRLAGEGRLAQITQPACWLGLLLIVLGAHELGHAAMAAWLDCDPEDVHLWPLGSLVGPSYSPRSAEHFLVALAGPAVSLALALVSALGLYLVWGAYAVWSPFGHELGDAGAPTLHGSPAIPLTRPWIVGWFGYLNWVVAVSNLLIPALPFDCGRMVRAFPGGAAVAPSRDNTLTFWLGQACAILLALVGLIRLVLMWRFDGVILITLGVLVELLVRSEARMLDEGGYFDPGAFGYDFSEGYTSLESGGAKVRPYRESALKRWRRRRSELRRQRRLAREAAEERRMDEILEKLHREGRAALTDDENRFLVRVSARYRNRAK